MALKYIEDIYDDWGGKSIAVVCSGKPSRKYGKEIDSHDIVIRFNDAVTTGYEDYVGTKKIVQTVVNMEYVYDILFKNKPEYTQEKIFVFNQKTVKEPLPDNVYTYKSKFRHTTDQKLGIYKPSSGCILMSTLWRAKLKADVYNCDFGKSGYYYPPTIEFINLLKKRSLSKYERRKDKIDNVHNANFYADKTQTRHDFPLEEKVMTGLKWHTFRR